MTHNGQGDERQYGAARPAHEGVVLPGDGSEPWIPGSTPEPEPEQAAPAGGQPWGQPWGPQDGVPQQGYGGEAYGGESYGAQPPAQAYPQGDQPYGYGGPAEGQAGQPGQESQGRHGRGHRQPEPQGYGQDGGQGQGYGQNAGQGYGQGYVEPLPPEAGAPLPGSADATQFLPPVPAAGSADATQFIAPVPGGPGPGMLPPERSAEATQFLPSQGSDADATQFIAPVPAQDGPYAVRPGEPGDRPPPAEFDNLFRTDGAGGPANSTQQMPKIDTGRPGPQAHGQQPYGQQAHGPQGYGQQPPAGPHEPTPGRGDGRRPSKIPLIAAVVVGCAVLGLGAGALMSGGDDSPSQDTSGTVSAESSPGTQSAPQDAADPAKSQAEALDKLLADSNDSRESVIAAVNSIKTCDNLDQAASDLRAAAEQRRGLVTRLKGLPIDKLPRNAALASALTQAWQASAAADDHYATWADEAKTKKGCRHGKVRGTQAAAEGNRSSGEATAAKNKASGLWNGIAGTYGLTKRGSQEL